MDHMKQIPQTYRLRLDNVPVGLTMLNAVLRALQWIIPKGMALKSPATNASSEAESGQTPGDFHL